MSYAESVQRAIDYIEENLEAELDLSAIAEVAYISVAQLYRVFYALTGHPVMDYVRKRRISVAADHLRNSKCTVEEIAWSSGFETYHAFAKVFKKIAGLTPAAYRKADMIFTFEPIRLYEQVAYMEDKEQAEHFPDVKVIRLLPARMYGYLHCSGQETGIENGAFRTVYEMLGTRKPIRNGPQKMRVFGYNVDLPEQQGEPRYGYQVLIDAGEEGLAGGPFNEVTFDGGLFAVGKTAAWPPETVQERWDRLVSEWLPKSTFEIGTPPYLEEFIAYNGKVTRMNLYLPVRRKYLYESIEIVELDGIKAFYSRGYGSKAQDEAERRLIEWYERGGKDGEGQTLGKYYMSFDYGNRGADDYWWENGILAANPESPCPEGLESKPLGFGRYVCCISKAYGLLTGVLDKMHRWIAASDRCRLDEGRQWFAEYHTPAGGTDLERDTVVKVYVPISFSTEVLEDDKPGQKK